MPQDWNSLPGVNALSPEEQNSRMLSVLQQLAGYFHGPVSDAEFTPDQLDRDVRMRDHGRGGKFDPAREDPRRQAPLGAPNDMKIDHEILNMWKSLMDESRATYRDLYNSPQNIMHPEI